MSAPAKTKAVRRRGEQGVQRQAADQHVSDLGGRLKSVRTAKGFTLAQLSKKTDVSIGTLSQIERGLVSPVVRTIYIVSEALGISPAWLVDPDNTKTEEVSKHVVRAGQGTLILKNAGVVKTLVTPEAAKALRAFIVQVEPGHGSGDGSYSHAGQEVGYVLSGSIQITVQDHQYDLSEGDCFAFESSLAHSFKNTGREPSSVFWVNMAP